MLLQSIFTFSKERIRKSNKIYEISNEILYDIGSGINRYK